VTGNYTFQKLVRRFTLPANEIFTLMYSAMSNLVLDDVHVTVITAITRDENMFKDDLQLHIGK